MASCVLWIFITLCPFLSHSESGDDASPDAEPSVFCSSMISLEINSLICGLVDDAAEIEYATLCKTGQTSCINGTLVNDTITFQELDILQKYELQTHFKDGAKENQNIYLVKIVKIPIPVVDNATYNSDEAIISIRYKHDYVDKPDFQLDIWGTRRTDEMTITVNYQQVTIGGDKLRNSNTYYVRVRAKPVDYFDGSWTAWSPVKSFSRTAAEDPSMVTYVILCTSLILVFGIVLMVLRWKKEIQAYISPNIPNPKATLAQIHREKERPPVSFSPEIFNDVSINRVDYAEEKQLAPEVDEDQEDTTGTCWSEAEGSRCSRSPSLCDKQDGDERKLEEMSHLKIKLLDQPKEGENEGGCQSLATLQRDCKDETYVTMSSLYKTQ
ncbi:interleukin-7 receptor subunit alpha isoform X2 [Colossoma macropomum]|uniref:interleukin-7 receptor subunit alpha isoform X2 n=1 Tax=Colossoma macropomum TaxID=42526 RepID=UPI001865419E|nr:interleukin-7 receptor subunit alpha isoform X2 [Colossoma macropomum]